jgi:cation-transporting ATPase 13A1
MQVIMLTGDNPLTACHVAKELKIAQRKLLILSHVAKDDDVTDDVIPSEEWEWQSIGGASKATLEADPAELGKDHDLCVTGDVSITSSHNVLRINHFYIINRGLPIS